MQFRFHSCTLYAIFFVRCSLENLCVSRALQHTFIKEFSVSNISVTTKKVRIGNIEATMVKIILGDFQNAGTSLMLQHMEEILSEFSKLRQSAKISPDEKVLIFEGSFDYIAFRVLAKRLRDPARAIMAYNSGLECYQVCWGEYADKGLKQDTRVDSQLITEV